MFIMFFYFILTYVSNHTFNSNVNDEEMITFHLMFELYYLFKLNLFGRKAH